MTIYDLFIYDRFGQCIIHKPFNQPAAASSPSNNQQSSSISSTAASKKSDRARLIFGLVFTMQALMNKFSPTASQQPDHSSTSSPTFPVQEPLLSFNTPLHKVHVLTQPTGLCFVLTTDTKFPTATDLLKKIYSLYVDYVSSTPHYTQGTIPSVTPDAFNTKLLTLLDPLLQN